MLNWSEYLQELKTRVKGMAKLEPEVVHGYAAISAAKTANPKLDSKTRELISLAVAVSLRCDGCIVTHTDLAKKHGATEEEIMEALGVAIAVNAGSALVFSARVMDAYEKV